MLMLEIEIKLYYKIFFSIILTNEILNLKYAILLFCFILLVELMDLFCKLVKQMVTKRLRFLNVAIQKRNKTLYLNITL
jgi:hypothetical protein